MAGYPPSYPPPSPPPPGQPYAPALQTSGLAIAALITAVIPCTAPVGLILGIVGIFSTGGTGRRGLGMAIAAIPISLAWIGLFSIGIAFMAELAMSMDEISKKVPAIFARDDRDPQAAYQALADVASEELMAAVSREQFEHWLKQIEEKHGLFRDSVDPIPQAAGGQFGSTRFRMRVRFVNGEVDCDLNMVLRKRQFKITNIHVNDLALRKAE